MGILEILYETVWLPLLDVIEDLIKMYESDTRFIRRVKGKETTKDMCTKQKAMLSQPMNGVPQHEIVETRNRAIRKLESLGYEVINTFFTDEWYSKKSMEERGVEQIALCFLAKSLENMSKCHAAYFCKGWQNARGCRIEHDAAVAYGLTVIEEE